jgi:hypothetical protein
MKKGELFIMPIYAGESFGSSEALEVFNPPAQDDDGM